MHPNTFYPFIPQNLVYKKATTKTRREIIQDLLSNDPRRKEEEEKKEQAPICRACRKIQNEDEVTVTVKGLYVLYEQNFVPETMFYFCPKQQCKNKIPHRTNLKQPYRIRADSLYTDIKIAVFKDNGLPIFNSVD